MPPSELQRGNIAAGPGRSGGPRILLAEDDKEMRHMLSQAFCGAGYEVLECCDGLELMEYMTSVLTPENPINVDLVVSDVRMPWVTGLEVLRGMHQYLGYPPVILITAFGDSKIHAIAENLGAAAVLDKPFEIADLLSLACALLPPHNTTME